MKLYTKQNYYDFFVPTLHCELREALKARGIIMPHSTSIKILRAIYIKERKKQEELN